jgi:preprotein translocase subunit SecA
MEAVAPHEVAGMEMHHDDAPSATEGNPFSPEALASQGLRVGRNDPCPCGSGQRYKQCHGKLA